MHDRQSLSHVRWDCKYHVVFFPKCRGKKLNGELRKRVRRMLKEFRRSRNVELFEGHVMADHFHGYLSIPSKYIAAFVIGFLKGKSSVRTHREALRNTRIADLHFWSRGYCGCTVGVDEKTIRKYIREQEKREKEQSGLDFD